MLWLCILLPSLEPAALRNLALWALQWSSQVSPCMPAGGSGPATLWLEIGASRQLFGSADALRAGIAAELATLGYHAALGVAPTPQGAALLARAGNSGATGHAGAGVGVGHTHNAVTLTELRALLEPLPLSLLALAPEQLTALRSTGLRTIGELLALPLAALAQRLGTDASNYLRRLCGQTPEPLRMLQAPAQFFSRCEFSYAVTDATALLFPLQRLLAGLQGYLRSLDRSVQRYTLLLEHRQGASTRLEIALARPAREAAQLLAVARERLAALALEAPVQALAVEAQEFLQPLVQQLDCFSHSAQHSEQLQTAVDRLVARLGGAAVQTLRCTADHRPERAWTALAAQHSVSMRAAVGSTAAAVALPLRPCWLLPEPCGIAVPQELLAGPERIESGWWDGADIARDYYLARGVAGARWWVYRDLRAGTWHLHGLWA